MSDNNKSNLNFGRTFGESAKNFFHQFTNIAIKTFFSPKVNLKPKLKKPNTSTLSFDDVFNASTGDILWVQPRYKPHC